MVYDAGNEPWASVRSCTSFNVQILICLTQSMKLETLIQCRFTIQNIKSGFCIFQHLFNTRVIGQGSAYFHGQHAAFYCSSHKPQPAQPMVRVDGSSNPITSAKLPCYLCWAGKLLGHEQVARGKDQKKGIGRCSLSWGVGKASPAKIPSPDWLWKGHQHPCLPFCLGKLHRGMHECTSDRTPHKLLFHLHWMSWINHSRNSTPSKSQTKKGRGKKTYRDLTDKSAAAFLFTV